VIEARERQLKRYGVPNAQLQGPSLRKYCALNPALRKFLEEASLSTGLSPRACQRVLKVARTVADLDSATAIEGAHLAEALAYREAACHKSLDCLA
jgi:magnesium chelatase family protein